MDRPGQDRARGSLPVPSPASGRGVPRGRGSPSSAHLGTRASLSSRRIPHVGSWVLSHDTGREVPENQTQGPLPVPAARQLSDRALAQAAGTAGLVWLAASGPERPGGVLASEDSTPPPTTSVSPVGPCLGTELLRGRDQTHGNATWQLSPKGAQLPLGGSRLLLHSCLGPLAPQGPGTGSDSDTSAV